MPKTTALIPYLKKNWLLFFVIAFLTIVYFVGIPEVPFHPDESTQLFMSADIEIFFTKPSALFWQPQNEQDLRQHYRMLDAPLTRYLAGIARQLTHQPPLPQDWDWSATWQENQSVGALPDPNLLLAGRLAVALFYPLNLFFLYKIMLTIHSPLAAWLSIFFFSSNALILLHTRRVMAEGALIFSILLTLYTITRLKAHRWVFAVPAALAFSSKQSTAPLIGLGLVAMLLLDIQDHKTRRRAHSIFSNTVLYLLTCLLAVFLLNPFLWQHPLQAAQAAWQGRITFTANQITTIAEKNPEKILNSIPQRTLGTVANLFITPPAVSDVANYQQQISQSASVYLNDPLNNFFRGPVWGSMYLALSAFGAFAALANYFRDNLSSKSLIILFLLASLLQFLSLVLFVAIPFQRYVAPLIPYTCIWQAYGLATLLQNAQPGMKHPGITGNK